MKKIFSVIGFIYPVFSTIIFFLAALLLENAFKNMTFYALIVPAVLIAAGGLIINSRIERKERSIYYLEIFITEILLNVLIYVNINSIYYFLENHFDFWWENMSLGGLVLLLYPALPILSFILVIIAGSAGNLIYKLKGSKNEKN